MFLFSSLQILFAWLRYSALSSHKVDLPCLIKFFPGRRTPEDTTNNSINNTLFTLKRGTTHKFKDGTCIS